MDDIKQIKFATENAANLRDDIIDFIMCMVNVTVLVLGKMLLGVMGRKCDNPCLCI